ncbi:MAG: DEAD/DEAH box helicase [Sandaracinaceae bacterium]|nr:DEAD/DEAH box helicase [Sandaracinaceae bacterium]
MSEGEAGSRDPFARLSPALQYQIANTLRFRSLRPVQLATIDAVLDGDDVVVLAPTAGGKTEAAFFPILSRMDTEAWEPVSVLYLSPIRALLNNQHKRLQHYAELLGRAVFKWHGDVGEGERKRFLKHPADILMTTPESLEAMLMSAKVPARTLFRGLRAVVIDEVHAFAGDDRGAHLSAILQRLSRFCRRDVQRIGLSATVGNPQEILRWLHGSSERGARVVDPPKPRVEPELRLDYVASVENAAQVIAASHRGQKRLVFVDSRRGVEQLTELLRRLGADAYLTHGSLSMSARREAEEAFEQGRDCVIVSTSALELGIDVGDLDRVLQLEVPTTVASFLQRMGRTGRREGTTPNCTFLTTKDASTLQAAALVRLVRRGYVEPVRPSRRAAHILAHQLMALGIQESGIAIGDWWAWLAGAAPFEDLSEADRRLLVDHMLSTGILANQDGRLWLGARGEKLYGRRHFAELYAVFSTPRLITVRWDTREVGTIDAGFLQALDEAEHAAFTLGGRPWQVVHVDWPRGTCDVKPADRGRAPRWPGTPRLLEREMCRAMREVLAGDDADGAWSPRATDVLARLRVEHDFLKDGPSVVQRDPDGLKWWTFAGGRASLLLARMLESELGGRCSAGNTAITCRAEAGRSWPALRDVLERWASEGRPNEADATRFARGLGRTKYGKLDPCLPEVLLDRLLAEQALDPASAREAVAEARHAVWSE